MIEMGVNPETLKNGITRAGQPLYVRRAEDQTAAPAESGEAKSGEGGAGCE